MNPAVIIRDETSADARVITDVTVVAFKTLPISQHTEQCFTGATRQAPRAAQ